MPQLDPYIFLHQITTLIIFFLFLYFYIRKVVIPKINLTLKYRNKKLAKLLLHDKANLWLYTKCNLYFSKSSINFINIFTNKIISVLFSYNKLLIYDLKITLLSFENNFLNNKFKRLNLMEWKRFSFYISN